MVKRTPKEVARDEVSKRIVTKDRAKANFIKWIDYTSELVGDYSDEVKQFWKEVKEETLKL